MKQSDRLSRSKLLWIIVLCYLMPALAVGIYGSMSAHPSEFWNVFSLGLFIAVCGSLILFLRLAGWEKALCQPAYPLQASPNEVLDENLNAAPAVNVEEYDLLQRSFIEAQEAQIRLLEEIDALTNELQQEVQNREYVNQEKEGLSAQLEQVKRDSLVELEKQQSRIRELQEAVAGQKDISEKKQQQLLQLEGKVGGLTEELKTLLKLAETDHTPSSNAIISEMPVEPPVASIKEMLSESHTKSNEEAFRQLKICLEIAQKMKGSQRFGSQIYSFLDSPADHFSLDLRRLCDRLRGESEIMALFYAPQDQHLLFASNQIKTLTGWSPEKFVQSFHELLLNEPEWSQGIQHLAIRSEVQIPVKLKTKAGTALELSACLGMIPTGIFRNHTIAVLYGTQPIQS